MADTKAARTALYAQVDELIHQWKDEPGGLIPIMQGAQEIMGCLDEEIQNYISDKTGIPVTTIYGVATFYSLFTLKPKGKYTIGMCLGTACYVRGAQQVFDELEKQLGITAGETDADGLFTLEATRCIGCCGLAPAMMINDEVFGRLTPSDVPRILEEHRQRG